MPERKRGGKFPLGLWRTSGRGTRFDGRPSLRLRVWLAVVGVLLVVLAGMGGGAIAQDSPTEIEDWHDLDAVRDNPGGDFVLVNDLDESTAGYEEVAGPSANGGAGFEPIGKSNSTFFGSFDGQGNTISGMNIDRPDTDDVGLFGYVSSGEIHDVSVVATIAGANSVGGIAGSLVDSEVTGSSVTGDVSGGGDVGALVGYNQGTIRDSNATATVSGDSDVGGLVGDNRVAVSDSYATGDVSGESSYAGGLVGSNAGTVNGSHATGNVTASRHTGGLVGINLDTIEKSYAKGNVSGDSEGIGGLVGQNGFDFGPTNGLIDKTYATGYVSGDVAGGLVGIQDTDDTETRNSYWNTETSGQASAIGDGGGTTTDVSGLTTAEMQGTDAETAMAAFDFEDWWTVATGEYPILQDGPDEPAPTTGVLQGTVADESNGTDIEGATVTVVGSDGASVTDSSTDAGGAYSVEIETGSYDVEVAADGYESKTVGPVEVEADATTTRDVELVAKRPGDALASFEVAATRSAVPRGNPLTIEFVNATTVDGNPFDGDATIAIERPDSDPLTATVEFEGGEATAGVLSMEATRAIPIGEYAGLEVRLDAEPSVADTYDVEVVANTDDALYFALSVDEDASDLDVVAGQTATVVVEIENTGAVRGTGAVLAIGDDVVENWFELDPDETTTEELDVPVSVGDESVELYTHDTVQQNEIENVPITVEEAAPAFAVTIDESASELATSHGETATVVAEVENTGPEAGTAEAIASTGAEETSATIVLASSETETVDLDLPVAIGDEAITVTVVDGDGSTHDSDEATIELSELAPDAATWQFDAGAAIESSPTIVDGTAYVGDHVGNVTAVDTTSGKAVWTTQVTENHIRTAVQVVEGTAYVGSDDGAVTALFVANGTERWQVETDGAVTSDPTRTDDTVYVGDHDGSLYALDAATGDERWNFSTGDAIMTAPTVVDGVVYVGSHDGWVYAVDAESGEEDWSVETGLSVNSAVTVVDGTAYVGSDDSTLYALDAADGSPVWEFDDPMAHVITAATVHDGTVYVGTDDTEYSPFGGPTTAVLYAVDAASGAEQWNVSVDRSGAEADWQFHAAPTVADGVVYASNVHGAIYGVDAASGDVLWAYEMADELWSSPTVVDGTLYVGSNDGTLSALDVPSTGSSVDSRVALGTLGHHGAWADAAIDHPLEGTVTDAATDEPLGGVTVNVTAGGELVESAVTDADGRYAVTAGPGTYTLTLEHAEYETKTVESVAIAAGESTVEDVSLDPKPGEIAVELADFEPVVVEGETARARVTTTNPGAATADGSISFDVGGETRAETTVSLEPGAETSVDLAWKTAAGDAGEYEATIASDDESVTAPLVVVGAGEPYYDVTVESIEPFPAGEQVNVTAFVENLGDGAGEQNITLSVVNSPARVVDVREDLVLAAGESATVNLTWETTRPEAATYDVFVESADAETATETTVTETREPRFDVAIEDIDPIVRPGESVTATVEVENAGAIGDAQTIALSSGDEVLDSTTVALGGAEQTTVELRWKTDETDAGTQPVTIESANDSIATDVAVLVGEVSYSGVTVSERDVVLGSYVTVRATVTNDDEEASTAYEAPIAVGTGVVDATAGEVAADGEETVTFAVPMDEPGEIDVRVGDADPVTVSVAEAWAQHGLGDGNRGHSAALDGPTVAVDERWNASVDATVTDPIVVGGVAYVGTEDGEVVAFDAETGDEVWRHDGGAAVTAPPTFADGHVYVGTATDVVALDADGDEQWRTSLGGEAGGIGLADGVLYVGTAADGDGAVRAIDATSGDVLWTFDAAGDVLAPPAVVGDTVYVGAHGSPDALYALNASPEALSDDERTRWSAPTVGNLVGAPAHADGTVYVGTAGVHPAVIAVDADTGDERWMVAAAAEILGSPAVADGTVYVGQADGEVRALDAETGATEWTHHTTGTGLEGSPAVVDETVFVGVADAVKEPRVVGLDAATGQERWHHAVGGIPATSPAVIGGAVYVGTDGGLLALEERVEGAILQVETISVNRTEVVEGESVSINTTVTNAGTEAGEFEINAECQREDVLMDCGVWVVELDPGEILQLSSEGNGLSQRGEWFVIVDERTTAGVPILAQSPGTLNGTVTDAVTGEPIANASVTAEIMIGGADDRRVTRGEVQTDENGEYEVRLRKNVYAVRFTYDRYVTAERLYVPIRWGQTTTLDVELEEKRWITGVLERPNGEPAANHTVSVDEMVRDEWSVIDWNVTDDTGAFELGVPGNRTYALVATEQHYTLREDRLYFPHNDVADLYASRAVTVDADPGAVIDVGAVQFPAGHNVNVTVVDANGDPVVGADVVWRDVNEAEETFGEFHWIGTDYDGRPGGSFDDPGVELPAGPAEVNVSTPWGEAANASVDLSEDVDIVFEPDSDLDDAPEFVVEELAVDEPAFAGDTVTANVTIENVGTVSGAQTVSLGVFGTDVEVERELDLLVGENETVTLEWETDDDDVGERGIVATTENETASEVVELIAKDRPYFYVEYDWAELVQEGNATNVTATVENRGEVAGVQDVTMLIEDEVVDTRSKLALGPGDRTRILLTWETEVGDGGVHNVTVASADHAPTDTLEVLEPPEPFFDVEVEETNSPVDAGEEVTVDATVLNTGREGGTQTVALKAADGTVLDEREVTLDAGVIRRPTDVTLTWETADGDAGAHDLTVESEDDASPVAVEVRDADDDGDGQEDDDEVAAFSVESVTNPVVRGEPIELRITGAVDENGEPLNDTMTMRFRRPGFDPLITSVPFEDGEAIRVALSSAGTEEVAPGQYTDIRVEAAGEASINDTYAVTIVEATHATDFSVEPVADPVAHGQPLELRITGAVDENGEPLNDTMTMRLGRPAFPPRISSVSFEDGEAVVEAMAAAGLEEVAPGDYTGNRVAVSADESINDTYAVTVTGEATGELAAFAVDPVADSIVQGEPLELAFADAVDGAGNSFTGSVSLIIERPGWGPLARSVAFEDGEATTEPLPGDATENVSAGAYDGLRVWVEADGSIDDTYDVELLADAEFDVEIDAVDGAVAGETVNVSVTVENIGDVEGTLDYGLDVDGTEVDDATVTLAAGESRSETFVWETSADDVGTYTLRVGDEAETVELAEADESAPRTISSDGQPGFGAGMAVVGVLIAALVGLRRR